MEQTKEISYQETKSRRSKQILRVTFPNGNSICFNNATTTYIEVLKQIGKENFSKIDLEIGHLPLISKTKHTKYMKYMRLITDDWYVNTQSNTEQKFLQLHSINQMLQLDLNIEIGTNFKITNISTEKQTKKGKSSLLVQFPDGEFIAENTPIDTFVQAIWKIGIDELQRKEISFSDKPLITRKQQYKGQIQIGPEQWILIPNTTKEKAKLLRIISLMMHLELKISIL